MFVLQTGPRYKAPEYLRRPQEQEEPVRAPAKKGADLSQTIKKKGAEQLLSETLAPGVKSVVMPLATKNDAYDIKIYSDDKKGTWLSTNASAYYDESLAYSDFVASINAPLAWTFTPANGKRMDQLNPSTRDKVMVEEDQFVVLQRDNNKGMLSIGYEYNYQAKAKVGQAVEGGAFEAVLEGVDEDKTAHVRIRDKKDPGISVLLSLKPGANPVDAGYLDPVSGHSIQIQIRDASHTTDNSLATADIGIYSEVYVLQHGQTPAYGYEQDGVTPIPAIGPGQNYVFCWGSTDPSSAGYKRTNSFFSLVAQDPSLLHNGLSVLREGESMDGPDLVNKGKLYNEGVSQLQTVQMSFKPVREGILTQDGQMITDSFIPIQSADGRKIFSLIYDGVSSGSYSKFYLRQTQSGEYELYYQADLGYWVKTDMPEGITVGNMTVGKAPTLPHTVAGDGGIVYIDTVGGYIGLGANVRPDITQLNQDGSLKNFEYTRFPFEKVPNGSDMDFHEDKPQYKPMGASDFGQPADQIVDKRGDRVQWDNGGVGIKFNLEGSTGEKLTLQYEKREVPVIGPSAVSEQPAPAGRQRQLSFSRSQQVRIPLAISNPGTAQVVITDVNGRQLTEKDIYVDKTADGFMLNSSALPAAGTYGYTITDGRNVTRGVFNIRP
ncbi:Uncharacterised protein [uncultured archaeon]|nr:Uncharacterised protein [uncultured archaeon]